MSNFRSMTCPLQTRPSKTSTWSSTSPSSLGRRLPSSSGSGSPRSSGGWTGSYQLSKYSTRVQTVSSSLASSPTAPLDACCCSISSHALSPPYRPARRSRPRHPALYEGQLQPRTRSQSSQNCPHPPSYGHLACSFLSSSILTLSLPTPFPPHLFRYICTTPRLLKAAESSTTRPTLRTPSPRIPTPRALL